MMIFSGVFGKTRHGSAFMKFAEPIEFDGHLPGSLGETIIGDADWYKDPPKERLCTTSKDTQSRFCPMRGSKRGISLTEYSGRVKAYDYYFSYWAGKRFAQWCKRTGRRMRILNTDKMRLETGHHVSDKVVHSEFNRGFTNGLCDDDRLHYFTEGNSEPHVKTIQLKSQMRNGEIKGCSPVICLNLTGLSDENLRTILRITNDFAEVESLENAMNKITQGVTL